MKTFLKRIMVFLLVSILSVSAFACGGETSESEKESVSQSQPESVSVVNISAELDKSEITGTETANLTVNVTGASDTSYTVSFSEEGVISVVDGVVSIVAEDLGYAKNITITVTANADTSKTAKVGIIAKPTPTEGRVYQLTSEMIAALGNDSITVNGLLTDSYTDFNQPMYSGTTAYEMVVYMEDGKWSGTWNRKVANSLTASPIKITDVYARSAESGYVDQNGKIGHALERVYIDKNNQVARKIEKNYMSVPAVWEEQHLYNHLAQLNINKFVYDEVNDVYEYVWNRSSYDDELLMTYLAFSLTPLMTETLDKVYLKVEDGQITKLLAQTAPVYMGTYYDSNNVEHHDSMSQSILELTFSDVGTTVVADPAPYAAGQHTELLAAAIAEMQGATNYTFQAVEKTTSAPSADGSDYEIMATGRPANNTSATGTVGLYGEVTNDAILLAETIKYSYSMDGKDYRTEYTGYKTNGDGTYDYFEYSSANAGFYGKKRISGNVTDVLPTFDFSANVFRYKSSYTAENGVTYYVFTLRETAITRDVAMEVSMHDNADDGAADGGQEFTITVTEDGHLYQTTYPYDLVSGTYIGSVTTTYGLVGTTVLDDTIFDNYVPRKIMDDWSDFNVMYYYDKPVGGTSQAITADVALGIVFGENIVDVPDVTVFTEVFGDNLNGPFFDWIEVGTDGEGNPIHHARINFNTSATEYDENSMITNLDEIYGKLETALTALGFSKSEANSGYAHGDTYICFIKNNVQIYLENNGTKHIWIYFCLTGDWTLKR